MAPVLEMCILSTCRPDCAKFNKEDDVKSQGKVVTAIHKKSN